MRNRMDWEHDLVEYIITNYADTVVFPVPDAEVLQRFNVRGYILNKLDSVKMMYRDPYDDDYECDGPPMDDTLEDEKS